MLELNNSQLEKIFFFGKPLVTYILALSSGLWWLDDDLLRGVIFLIGLYVFTFHTGYRVFFYTARKYFYFTYATPTLIATILFCVGFLL